MRGLLIKYWPHLLLAVWLAAAAIATLMPAPEGIQGVPGRYHPCLICGHRGTADGLLNVVLFIPFGLALAARGKSVRAAFLAGLVLSTMVEIGQLMIPGRWPGLPDILWNSTGAALGVILFRVVRARLESRVGHGGLVNSIGTAFCFVVMGVAMSPWPPDTAYWGQWTPDLGDMPEYEGHVLSANLNGAPFPSGPMSYEDRSSELFRADWSLEGLIVVGTAPDGISPILSIYDEDERQIALLGADSDALVFRERTIGAHLRLDSPYLRVPAAFAELSEGDTAVIGVHRGTDICVRLAAVAKCGLGISLGRTWSLLNSIDSRSERLLRAIDLTWLLLIFVPLGALAPDWKHRLAYGLIATMGACVSILTTPLVPGPWTEVAAGGSGLVLGWLVVEALVWVSNSSYRSEGEAMESRV